MKTCSRCKDPKSLDDFYNNSRTKDGKQSRCKDCQALTKRSKEYQAYAKTYRQTHRDDIQAYEESRQEQNRAYGREYRRTHREELAAKDKAYRAQKPRPSQKTPILTTAERFWQKVDKETCLGETCGCHKGLGCCWWWTACLNNKGYGWFHYKGITYLAHRVSYALMNNLEIDTLTDEIKVLHACDVPRCMRHLFTGTQRDNLLDAAQKGRMGRVSRLTVLEVQQIRALQGVVLQRLIAKQFGISKTLVSLIQNHKLLKRIL